MDFEIFNVYIFGEIKSLKNKLYTHMSTESKTQGPKGYCSIDLQLYTDNFPSLFLIRYQNKYIADDKGISANTSHTTTSLSIIYSNGLGG